MLSNCKRLQDVTFECDERTWINQERNNFGWYRQQYPVLNKLNLPVSMEVLKYFYFSDMQERNLTPNSQYFRCYALLWSYFLGRVSGQINFQGRSVWTLIEQNFPGALRKTSLDILNPLSNPFFAMVLIAGLGFIIINKILD